MVFTAQRAMRHNPDSTIFEAANSGEFACSRDHKEVVFHKAVISAELVDDSLKGSTNTRGLVANKYSRRW